MPVYRPDPTEHQHAKQMRDAVEKSRELLKQPPPDAFAGRKTQEPFPEENKEK